MNIPALRGLVQERDQLRKDLLSLVQERDQLRRDSLSLAQERDQLRKPLFVPPGHFYSPIPSLDDVRANEERIFHVPRTLPAIDMNEKEQWQFFNVFKEFYKEIPFTSDKTDNLRYFFNNGNYSYSDAICLYGMIRQVKPKRIIEVGSGYSSCLVLDTNEIFFDNAIFCTFIEPYPDLLLSLISDSDKEKVELIPSKLQDVDLNLFSSLEENDILFIDSTHVSKVDSDVNYILFEILPSLKSGVYIHFHDVFYPFEYLQQWVYEGRAWNEDYILRAFLQYNDTFKIVFFNTFLEHFFAQEFIKEMPLCMKNLGGSIWLRKNKVTHSKIVSNNSYL